MYCISVWVLLRPAALQTDCLQGCSACSGAASPHLINEVTGESGAQRLRKLSATIRPSVKAHTLNAKGVHLGLTAAAGAWRPASIVASLGTLIWHLTPCLFYNAEAAELHQQCQQSPSVYYHNRSCYATRLPCRVAAVALPHHPVHLLVHPAASRLQLPLNLCSACRCFH